MGNNVKYSQRTEIRA